MARTVPKHSVHSHQRGEYVALCSFCGVEWPRSKLRKDGAGLFVCPDEGPGKDAVTLSNEIAACANQPRKTRRPMDAEPVRNETYSGPGTSTADAIAKAFGGAQ